MKSRCFPESNYKAFFINGKTLRIKLDPNKPITNLKYPEFMDVKITNWCTGDCPYCYQDSGKEDSGYRNALEKLDKYFLGLSPNQRPFQVAIGGGNPNEHPDFLDILQMFKFYGIVPNYTTNGIGITEDVADWTEELCGGVAVSCHPHLQSSWENAVKLLHNRVQTNLHIIIKDQSSIDRFKAIYDEYQEKIAYFVLLPYEKVGRAFEKNITTNIVDFSYLTEAINEIGSTEKIAFGANFYRYLCGSDFKISLYEPEIFSKFLDVKDMKFYNSSFNLIEAK